jgi:hypothetical protein
MLGLTSLLLVILAGAAAAFIASAIAWMVLPHHRSDYARLPDEDGTMAVLGTQDLKPGFYNFPHCKNWDDFKNEGIQKKFADGPIGFITILPSGMPPMGKNMLQQFIYYAVTGVFIAYVVSLSQPAGADYISVFRTTGAVAFLAYGFGSLPESIWYGKPWSVQLKHLADSLFYALMTAGVYGWLWPASA